MTQALNRLLRVGLALCMTGGVVPAAFGQETDVIARANALRNAGAFDSAVVLLQAAHERVPADHRIEFMLGETLYWLGDFTRAADHFRNVLRADPSNASARRQLLEIRTASAPWVRSRVTREDDSQPLDRTSGEFEAGFFMNPLWSLGMRAGLQQATGEGAQLRQIEGRAEVRGYLPRARIDLMVSGGVSAQESNPGFFDGYVGEPVGSAEIARRFGNGWRGAASFERAIYTATTASLTNPIPFTRPRVRLQFDRRGWLGEAAAYQESFPDVNRIMTAYAWLLAPVFTTPSALLQAGYAFSYQDSEESRFRAGVYDPYFTPDREQQHSIAASFVTWHARGAKLQVNGSYAVFGRRGVPGVASSATETFHPYNVRAAATVPLGTTHAFTIEAERMKTAFYHNTRLAALISFRFAPRPAT